MEIRELPLDDLVLDPNLNLRDRLDDFTVERYAESWERLPPITVFEVDGRWLLADGFHRHAAAVMLGARRSRRRSAQGTFTDALDFVAERQPVPRPAADPRRASPGGRGQAAAAPRLVRPPDGRGAGRQPRAGRQDPPEPDRGGPDARTTPGASGPTARSTRRPACPRTRTSGCPRASRSRSRTTRATAAAARATRPPGTTRPRPLPAVAKPAPATPTAHPPGRHADAKAVGAVRPRPVRPRRRSTRCSP